MKAAAKRPLLDLPFGRMNVGTAAVFIDGGYLDKVMYYDFRNARLDFEKLSRALAAPDELLRAYYYHCLPYQSQTPTQEEKDRFASKQRFFKALSFLPRFEVRLGRLVCRGYDGNGQPIFVQKRVDLMVGVDMALLAGKGRITKAVLVSGDSDLIPSVEAVKREGVLTVLYHGSFSDDTRPSRELVEVCDERVQLSDTFVDTLLRT